MNKDSKKFYKEIYILFPVHTKNEREYLKRIKKQIQEYDDQSYDELIEIFGTPINVVEAYYDTVSSQYLTKKMSNKKMILTTCFIVIVLALCVSLYRDSIIQQEYEDFHNSIPVEYEETIEEVE